MADLIIAVGIIGPPLILLAAAVLFAWHYSRRVENAMRQSAAEYAESAQLSQRFGQQAASDMGKPVRLNRIDAATGHFPDENSGTGWHQIRKQRRSLITGTIMACAIHYAISIAALLWAYSAHIRNGQFRVSLFLILGYLASAPEIALVLIYLRANRSSWARAISAYVAVLAIAAIWSGLFRFPSVLASTAVSLALLPLPGLIIITSRWIRPFAIVLASIVITLCAFVLVFAYVVKSSVVSQMEAAYHQPAILAISVIGNIAGTFFFLWLIGLKSIRIPVTLLISAAAVGQIIDATIHPVLWSPISLLFSVLVGFPHVVLYWLVTAYVFRFLNRFAGNGLHVSSLVQLYFGWIYLSVYWAVYAYFLRQNGYLPRVSAIFGSLLVSVIVLRVFLKHHRRHHTAAPGKRLVLLRVFGRPDETRSLVELLDSTWRTVGSVDMIIGPDIGAFAGSVEVVEAYLRRRLTTMYLQNADDVRSRIAKLRRNMQADARYPINDLYCFANVWPEALIQLLPGADAVLMDLRGFSEENRGCVFELAQVVQLVPLRRITLLTDESTDMDALQATATRAWTAAQNQFAGPNQSDPALDVVMASELDSMAQRILMRRVAAAAYL